MKELLESLNHCPFCGDELDCQLMFDVYSSDCPVNHTSSHSTGTRFWLFRNKDKVPYAINIVVNEIQIHYSINYNATNILNLNKQQGSKLIMELDYLMELSLDESYLKNKLKTIITFS